MPTFLREEGWRYGGRTDRVKGVLSEFDHAAAKAVIQRTGFYVYAEQ
ncbi:hypothetical protein [Aureimonas psammosilenae]|nr:hypothetical protein [Aureimonas psammosilenae]